MSELDQKEGWVLKNWRFQIVVLEKTLESPLDCKDLKLVHPKGNQPWIFIERTDAEAEAPILWPPEAKSRHIGKDPDAGKDWRQRRLQQKMRWLDSITASMDMNLSKLQEIARNRGARRSAVHEVIKSQTQLRDWTELNTNKKLKKREKFGDWQNLYLPQRLVKSQERFILLEW